MDYVSAATLPRRFHGQQAEISLQIPSSFCPWSPQEHKFISDTSQSRQTLAIGTMSSKILAILGDANAGKATLAGHMLFAVSCLKLFQGWL